MSKTTATIFDIKRFAIHDGDGIRTTVFFKGCPLHCVWCHNPEGISFQPEVQFVPGKCIGCGECAAVCKANAHSFSENGHHFYRDSCVKCFCCTENCPTEALIRCGREADIDEVLNLVMEDEKFYRQSGGGVTLSGGECLCQADFCEELLRELKARGINTAVDTSGFVPKASLDKVIPYTDVFLYDIKHISSEVHRKYTGVPNEQILENLKYLQEMQKLTEIRIPLIPGVNDDIETIHGIGILLQPMDSIKGVRVLAYNNLTGSKFSMIGRENTLPDVDPPDEEKMQLVRSILTSYGLIVMQ